MLKLVLALGISGPPELLGIITAGMLVQIIGLVRLCMGCLDA